MFLTVLWAAIFVFMTQEANMRAQATLLTNEWLKLTSTALSTILILLNMPIKLTKYWKITTIIALFCCKLYILFCILQYYLYHINCKYWFLCTYVTLHTIILVCSPCSLKGIEFVFLNHWITRSSLTTFHFILQDLIESLDYLMKLGFHHVCHLRVNTK